MMCRPREPRHPRSLLQLPLRHVVYVIMTTKWKEGRATVRVPFVCRDASGRHCRLMSNRVLRTYIRIMFTLHCLAAWAIGGPRETSSIDGSRFQHRVKDVNTSSQLNQRERYCLVRIYLYALFECRLQRLIQTNAVRAKNTTHKKIIRTKTENNASPKGRTHGIVEHIHSKKRYLYVLPTPKSRNKYMQLPHLALQDLELHHAPLAHETQRHCWVRFQGLSLPAGSDEKPGSLA